MTMSSAAAPINETQRRHYLAAMGVVSWYPRVRLPNAPAPCLFALDTHDSQLGAQSVVQPPIPRDIASQSTANRAALLPALAKREPSPSRPNPALSASVSQPPGPTSSNPTPRFSLSIRLVDQWLVLDSLPKGMNEPSRPALKLLDNILLALGRSDRSIKVQHAVQWPLFDNPRVDQTKAQAKLYVSEKIDQLIRQHQPTLMLSFGAVMPKLQDWQQPEGHYGDLPWIALPSLYRCLSEPAQKAIVWQRLHHLALAS